MLSVGEILEREKLLLQVWDDEGVCVKKFPELGVKIMQTESGQCFLISAQGEGIFSKTIVNYGACNKKMSEKDVLAFLKDFCMKPIREDITSQSQNDFDILLGFAVPTEVAGCDEFVNLLKLQLDDKKKNLTTVQGKNLSEKFVPLFRSLDLAVSVAKSQPNTSTQVDKFYKNLGL